MREGADPWMFILQALFLFGANTEVVNPLVERVLKEIPPQGGAADSGEETTDTSQ